MELNSVQKTAIDSINLSEIDFGTIYAVMRSGKTAIMINLLVNYKFTNVLWICNDTVEQSFQLKDEFIQWGHEKYYTNHVRPIHFKSLHKVNVSDYDIVIFNECQNITENIYNFISKAKRIIGLTGTYPNKVEKKKLLIKLGLDNIIFNYDIIEGVKDNIISNYNIYIKYIKPDEDKNIKIKTKKGSFNSSEQGIIDNYEGRLKLLDLAIKPYKDSKDKINLEISTFQEYALETSENQEKLRKLYTDSSKLKEVLVPLWEEKRNTLLFYQKKINSLQSKVKYTKTYILNHPDKRILIFSQDNVHASSIGNNIFSSKTDSLYLNMFKQKDINNLILVNKGSIGANYDDINTVIMLAPNKSNTSVIQKIARGLKKKNDKVRVDIIIPYSSDIQLDWIKTALENVDHSNIIYS